MKQNMQIMQLLKLATSKVAKGGSTVMAANKTQSVNELQSNMMMQELLPGMIL